MVRSNPWLRMRRIRLTLLAATIALLVAGLTSPAAFAAKRTGNNVTTTTTTRPPTTTTTKPPTTTTTKPPTTTTTAAPTTTTTAAPTTTTTAVPVPTVPTDRVLLDSNRTGNYEIFSMRSDGTEPLQLTAGATYDSWWPKVSPDRMHILFYRTPAGTHDSDYKQTSLWVMNADGTDVRMLLDVGAYGWLFQGHAEWSPDGTQLVMFGGGATLGGTQIYVTNADGTNPRLVKSRRGANVDPSWSPDGTSLLFIGCATSTCSRAAYEVFKIKADGTNEQQLTNDAVPDFDPYFSPDGSSIAWLRNTGSGSTWGVYKMAADGSGQSSVIDDGGVNSKPAWAGDSTTLYFHRAAPGHFSFSVWRIRSDGSGLTQLPVRATEKWSDEYPIAASR